MIEVSLFSVALAAMMLGAGTDYAIFLLGRYQEGRRRGRDRAAALADAYRGVAPVIIGSALTLSVALACLGFAKVRVFSSVGIPCAIGILVTVLAALTLTPGADRPRGAARHPGTAAVIHGSAMAAGRRRGRAVARPHPGGRRRG